MMLQNSWSDYVPNYYQGNMIKGLCAVSGIYDLQSLLPTYVSDALNIDHLEAKANSPILQPLPKPVPVPVIIAFGDKKSFW